MGKPKDPRPVPDCPADACPHEQRAIHLADRVRNLEGARKHLLRQLADRDSQLELRRQLAMPPAPIADRKPRARRHGHTRRGFPVLLCSDWHVEEPVDAGKVGGLNRYNLKIAAGCIAELAEAFEWLARDSRFDCREAGIWLGGDLFSGYIHEELAETNFLSPIQAVMFLQKHIARMLRKILAITPFERIRVWCNDGNHGRLTHKIRVQTRTENSLEWLLYQTLATHFEGEPRLTWHIAEGVYLYQEIFGRTFAFAHGDVYKGGTGIAGPIAPIRRGLNDLRKYRALDHLCVGHFHRYETAEDITINGSMIGINPFAMSLHCPPEPPRQAWFMVDADRGKCLTAPVWFSNR